METGMAAAVTSQRTPISEGTSMNFESPDREASALAERGNDEYDVANYEAAAALFREAIEAGATWAYINLGNALQEAGDESGAAEAFKAGAEAGDLDAAFNLAQLRSSQGRHEEARAVHRTLIERGYVKSLDQEAWYVHEDDGDRAEGRRMMLEAAQAPGAEGDRAAAIYGTWLWEDESDPSAEPYLERGVRTWPEAWVPLLDLRGKASRAARLRGPKR